MDHCLLAEKPEIQSQNKKPPIPAPTAVTPLQVDSMTTIIVGNLSCFMPQNTTPLGPKKDLHFLLEKVKNKDKKRR
jgi:hypothetical protein